MPSDKEYPDFASNNVTLCDDGKYRWVFELNLFTNPSIFLTVFKIFFFIILGIASVATVADVINYGFDAESVLNTLKIFGYVFLGMTALVVIGCLVHAAINGGKYCVLFEMDGKGVNHIELPKNVKKAAAVGNIALLAGVLAGKPSVAGIGLMSAARTEMYSEFEKVRKVKMYKTRRLIKVNCLLDHNQVYAEKEDLDFVYAYIRGRCPNIKK